MSWDPWGEAERRAGLEVLVRRLPPELEPAIWYPYRGRRWVVLDDRLAPHEQRAALAHELVHDERGGGADLPGMPAQWQAIVARDEATCDRVAAVRLVPLELLSRFCDELAEFGQGVAPDDVCEEFDVPRWVAVAALEALVRYERGRGT